MLYGFETTVDLSDVCVEVEGDAIESFVDENEEEVLDHIGTRRVEEWAQENEYSFGNPEELAGLEQIELAYSNLDPSDKYEFVRNQWDSVLTAQFYTGRGLAQWTAGEIKSALVVLTGELVDRTDRAQIELNDQRAAHLIALTEAKDDTAVEAAVVVPTVTATESL